MDMMGPYVIAMGLILAVALGWVAVQYGARRFAARHPEYGPHRECIGCGKACSCEEKTTADDADNADSKEERPVNH